MIDALQIAASGMQAQQLAVDTIANNVANLNTAGFKTVRVHFGDLVSREVAAAGQLAGAEGADPATGAGGVQRAGTGVTVTGLTRVFETGELRQTGSPMDLALEGDGFVEVERDGARAYWRGGALVVNADGLLSTIEGAVLRPGIAIPPNATALAIGADGHVFAVAPQHSAPIALGRIDVVRFANPGGLTVLGGNTYQASDASGEPILGRPGEAGVGTLAQGFLEGSNVKMLDELVSLLVAQRAYEVNAKVVQASDEMLAMVNGLRK